MTRDEFLARCGNAYDAGLATPERLRLLQDWIEMVARFEAGQVEIAIEILDRERKRLGGMFQNVTGHNDRDGYGVIELAAILCHPCQVCATTGRDGAWWTRPGLRSRDGRNAGRDCVEPGDMTARSGWWS